MSFRVLARSIHAARIYRPALFAPKVQLASSMAATARRTYAAVPDDPHDPLDPVAPYLVSEAIIKDHNELRDYYKKIVNSKDRDDQVRYQNAFVWELSRHAISEEIVVYPALETETPGGKVRAEKDRDQHQVVKDQLYKFQNLSPEDPDFLPTLKALYKDLEQHMIEEEEDDLVKLEASLTETESKELSESFERTKMFTPTRSHPSAPNRPPFETVAGLMAAPIDRLKDMFRKFPKEKEGTDSQNGTANTECSSLAMAEGMERISSMMGVYLSRCTGTGN
ncbi:HHE domain protein [Xylariomycetidae sp. FL2044]|nr:HHE domain protein [Xylariomycetidae sp. FL2044]